jgi:hypothetical protein
MHDLETIASELRLLLALRARLDSLRTNVFSSRISLPNLSFTTGARRGAKRSRGDGTIVTPAGVAKVPALKLALATRAKGLVSASFEQRQPPECSRSPTMTETQRTTEPAWAEFCDDALESVAIVRTAAIESPCRAT